jgi:hypothetical protein
VLAWKALKEGCLIAVRRVGRRVSTAQSSLRLGEAAVRVRFPLATSGVPVRGVQVPDLYATMLHLMGVDHERFTYLSQGRRFRLTDVSGKVVRALVA